MITASNIDTVLARQRSNATRTAFYKATVNKQLANPSQYLKPLPTGK